VCQDWLWKARKRAPGRGVVDRAPNVVVEEVGQVLVGAGAVRWQGAQPRRVEELAAHEVEVRAAGSGRQGGPAARPAVQTVRDRVPEVLVDEVEQFGGPLLGEDVDSGAVVDAGVVREVDLVVRCVGGALAPGVDRARSVRRRP